MDGMQNTTDLSELFNDIEGPATTISTEEVQEQPKVQTASVAEGTPAPQPVAQAISETLPVQQAPQAVPQVEIPQPTPVPTSSVSTPQSTIPVASPMPAPMVQQPQAPVAVGSDFSIGLPTEMQSELADVGIEIGDIGVKVSRVPIDRYRASASKIDRIGFITNKVIPIKMHYLEGIGSIVCFNGKCCEVAGTPMVRYLFPIVVYTTDSDGNISGGKVTLQMLSVGEEIYKTIITISKSCAPMGGIDHVDLLVTCTDESYQKMTFVQAGPAAWRQYPQIANFLNEKWMQDGAKSYMAVARKMDEETFLKVMNLDDAGADNSAQSFDPSKNTDLSKFFS